MVNLPAHHLSMRDQSLSGGGGYKTVGGGGSSFTPIEGGGGREADKFQAICRG